MKKLYIIFSALLVIGITAGILYLTVIRPGNTELPQDVVLQTAFEEEYSFEESPNKVRLIEFMYTNCPDVCPVTTLELSKLRNKLEKEGVFGDQVEFLTITIDPKHDTLEVLQDYANRFEVTESDEGWYFLRGTDEDTKKLADSLNFLYRDPGTGEIVHTSYSYLLDEKDNLLDQFTMGDKFDTDKAFNKILKTIN